VTRARAIALALAWILCALNPVQAQDAPALRARQAELRDRLASNAFGRPLYLESSDRSGHLRGDIYALVPHAFARVSPGLRSAGQWCDILILHQNVKGCRASSGPGGDHLNLNIGRKFDQPLADAYPFDFRFTVAASRPDYLRVTLRADDGPFGTSEYLIVLEVVPADPATSFLHLSYAYAYGPTARLAMQGYLATLGRGKVGFSVVTGGADGAPAFIGGTRGVVERNTMRYYLAIEAWLAALSLPPDDQLESRLNDWYAGVERYTRQLHELERDEYLAMKRREVSRR
jgi:hypothetical protein